MRKWHVAAVVCGFASLLLLLTSLASHHWLVNDNANAGLWKACTATLVDIDTLVGTVCFEFGMDVKVYIHVTRALLIMGAFMGFISCAQLSLLFFCSEIGNCSILKTAVRASHVAGIFALVAMGTFTRVSWATRSDVVFPATSYGWSFVLGWACGLLFLITGGLAHTVSTYEQSAAGRDVGQPLQGDTRIFMESV